MDKEIAVQDNIFVSKVSPNGKLCGVFEFDGETSYFYLYRIPIHKSEGKVLDFIHITSQTPKFSDKDVEVRWNNSGDSVGLYIFRHLWAVFCVSGQKYGGDYTAGGKAQIPDDISLSFAPSD